MKLPHRDVPVVHLHRAQRTDQAAAGTLLGGRLSDQQVGTRSVLSQELRHRLHHAADLIEHVGNLVDLLLALLIGGTHHADMRLRQRIDRIRLLLHQLVGLREPLLRVHNRLQVELALAPAAQAGVHECLHGGCQRGEGLAHHAVNHVHHATHGGDVVAQYRHVGGHPPQRTIGNLLGGGSVNLRLLNCSIHGVGIAQLADVLQTGNSLHSGKFMVPHVHRLLVKPPRTKSANSTEDNQYTEH